MTEAVSRQHQGHKNAGQTTLNREQRKLTKSEAGYQVGGGIPQLRCGDCHFYQGETCRIVEGKIAYEDVCNQFEPAREKGSMTADVADAIGRAAADLPSLDMYIYRVSENKQTGTRRWFATASGVKLDKYEERMSVPLFKDFIRRAETREPVPDAFASKAWNGGLPYLGVAHYLDQDGYAIVGPTEKIWVDGDVFKAKGTFRDTPVANRAYEAIRRDSEQDLPEDQRIRISIAFVDWEHEHEGHGVFKRRSLRESCAMCEAGTNNKVYKKGHLVHLALTRRPAYEESDISLEERSTMTTKRDDAASIIGDDLADELEKRRLESFTQRSDGDIAPGAVVVKREGDEEGEPEGGAEIAKSPAKMLALKGATTLDEAEAALAERSEGDVEYVDHWDVLRAVLTNIAGPDKGEAIKSVVDDFQSQLDVMTARAVINLNSILEAETAAAGDSAPDLSPPVERSQGQEETMAESHPLDAAFASLREAYDEAAETPLDRASRLAMIQPAMNEIGEVIRRSVAGAEGSPQAEGAAGVDVSQLQSIVEQAVAPLQAQIAELKGEATVKRSVSETPKIPGPRNLAHRNPQVPEAVTRMNGQSSAKPGSLKSIIRRSVGLGN